MTDTLKNAAQALNSFDPNTMIAATPNTGTAPVAEPAPLIAHEQESFVDEWDKTPHDTPPVRTWRDVADRSPGSPEYISAWYDTPVQAPQQAAAAPVVQAPAAAPVAAPPKDYGYSWTVNGSGEDISNVLSLEDGQRLQLQPGADLAPLWENAAAGKTRLSEDALKKYGWNPPAAPTTT